MSDRQLPAFDQPPVSEVVMSVQFDPLSDLNPLHMGRWWTDERRGRYPRTEEKAPLEPTREEFKAPSQRALNVKVMGVPPSPSIWFLTEDRSELLQIQRDRFTRNWAKVGSDGSYPRFKSLFPSFESDFTDFAHFLDAEGLGTPVIRQCELTYVNGIPVDSNWSRHGQLKELVAPWSGELTDGFLGEPEDVQVNLRYVIPSGEDEPIGRMYVAVQPAWTPDHQPIVLMTLTARGAPGSADFEGVRGFMTLAHEWIVRGFATLTTSKMHETWERRA